jgi:hypothetical protein
VIVGFATTDEAYASCMQYAPNVADCRREVADHTVNGVWCDGDVYFEAGKPPRCIPAATLAAKLAAEQKSPLPAPGSPVSATSPFLLLAAAVFAIGGGLLLVSRLD